MFYFFIASLSSFLLLTLVGFLIKNQNLKLESYIKNDAESSKNSLIEKYKNKIESFKQRTNSEIENINDSISLLSENLESQEDRLNKRKTRLENTQKKHEELNKSLVTTKEKLKETTSSLLVELEKVSGSNQTQAQEQIINKLKVQAKDTLSTNLNFYVERQKKLANIFSQDILKSSIQRITAESSVDKSNRILKLASRNSFKKIMQKQSILEVLSQTLNVEIEPLERENSFKVSSFIMWNAEIAKKVISKIALSMSFKESQLEALIKKSQEEFKRTLITTGKKAAQKLGLQNQSDRLYEIIGRLNYRTSYGQNILKHSFETGYLCSLIASQVGADPRVALLGGFFHDIGKALDQETEGSHDVLGMEFLKEEGFPFEIYHPAHSHHNIVPVETVEAEIVIIGDKLSAARQGARTESLEMYIQRVQGLERIAAENNLVSKSFAVSAGREIRAFLDTKNTKDEDMAVVAKDLVGKIQSELVYPGKIKVNVIREYKFSSVAK